MRDRRVLPARRPRWGARRSRRRRARRVQGFLRAAAGGEDAGGEPAEGVHPRRWMRQRGAAHEPPREVLVLTRRPRCHRCVRPVLRSQRFRPG